VIDWNVKRDEQEPNEEKPKQEEPPPAQAILEELLAKALDQHGVEIKPNGTDAVRAVQKDKVRFLFKAAYEAEHPTGERQAWRRALSQAKATVVVEGVVDGVPYLWWLLPPV
jgi:hypothetical protein